nr:NADPH:adrenodoxin oxidoreductase, mitochondrial [Tanacetum cinerariifolium]
TSKAKAFTKDGPEGRPTNRPRYQLVARPPNHFRRPTCCLVSIPKGVGAGRGGSSSAFGNGDLFVDDQRDISKYIDKVNRHVVRPSDIDGGRTGRSNGSGNGDLFENDLVDIGHDIDEGNKDVVRWKGIHRGRCSSSAIGEGDRIVDDYTKDVEEGIDELYMKSSQCRRGSNIVDTPPTESSHRLCIYPYQNGPPKELATTDIATHALDALRESSIRRGPVQAACTAKELREILAIKDLHINIKEADLLKTSADEEEKKNSHICRRVFELLSKASSSASPHPSLGQRELYFTFFRKLKKILESSKRSGYVNSANFETTTLKGFPAQSIRSSNAIALDSPYLLVFITNTSQSRQHGKSESDSYYLSD